jgi:hypothetical protein
MTREHFDSLVYTKESDIIRVGGIIEGIEYPTLANFDMLCIKLSEYNCKATILFNGLNSGDHVSEEHRKGEAVDFTINKELPVFTIVVLMIRSGFNGIGIYHNSICYSFHGDITDIRQWIGYKKKDEKQWHPYIALVNDPKLLSMSK